MLMPPGRRRPRAALGAVAALAFASFGPAAHTEPAPTFAALLAQAQRAAPRLTEGEADVARAQGLADQARARPNPSVSFEAENFAGQSPYRGFDQSELTFSVEQPFELGGKRPARVAAGRAELDAARARRDQGRADFAADLARAYVEAEASDRRLAFSQEALGLAQEDHRVATAMVEAGKEAGVRQVQAQATVAGARADVDAAQAARATAFAKLSALAGSPAPITSIPNGLLAHADRVETFPSPDPLAAPAYVTALADREAAARRIRVERTKATPDLTVSVGARRIVGDDASALVAGVSAPLPLFDRNRGNIAAAGGELAAAEARLNGARLDAEADGRAAVAQAAAAQSRVAAATESEAAAEEAYRLSRLGYEGGKLSLLELTNARRALVEARAKTLNARVERLNAEAALARLQGRAPFGDQQ